MPGGFPLGLEICNGNDQGTDTANSRGTLLAIANGAYGAYTQLIASTPSDTSWMIVTLWRNGTANTGNQESVKIAIGAAGSEVVVAADLMVGGSVNALLQDHYSFPIAIPAGKAISAAAAGKVVGDLVYCNVQLFDGAFTQMEGCAGVDSLGFVLATVHGAVVVGGAANTKGSYAQVVASTSRDYIGLMACVGGQSNVASWAGDTELWDIAVGAGGSEVVIVPNIPVALGTGGHTSRGPFFVPIPAGTRLSARWQGSTGVASMGITLYGIYQ